MPPWASFLADVTVGHAFGAVVGALVAYALVREVKRAPDGIEYSRGMHFIQPGAVMEAYRLGYEDAVRDEREKAAAAADDPDIVSMAEYQISRGRGS